MDWVVLGFLVTSLFLYCLLGGADFGAGVLELFFPKDKERREAYRNLVIKAMGPVWEANHIWLIILIVILFNGFPKAYAELSIYFHVPLMIMLIGIVFRGCAFTFRTYDMVKDRTRDLYSLAFGISSALTPIMFGVIVGALMLGRVDPDAPTYYAKYIAPWFNIFCLSVGLFVLNIFMFLAGTFLIGETKDPPTIEYFTRCVQRINITMVASGGFVFIAAYLSGLDLLNDFIEHPISFFGLIGATIPLIVFWLLLKKERPWVLRTIVGFQLAMILLAWLATMFPYFLIYKEGTGLSIFQTIAVAPTITILGWSLILGSLLFLPALYYLIVVFKLQKKAS